MKEHRLLTPPFVETNTKCDYFQLSRRSSRTASPAYRIWHYDLGHHDATGLYCAIDRLNLIGLCNVWYGNSSSKLNHRRSTRSIYDWLWPTLIPRAFMRAIAKARYLFSNVPRESQWS